MDIQQLKVLAHRVRDVMQQSNHPIGHNQSLDLVAALPGLRNWPEVLAFPDRVAACRVDESSAGRLASRLKKFELQLSPQAMLSALLSAVPEHSANVPQIWPLGPKPGVYITTSQNAINALLARYEAATDGALVYAERAGNHWDSSIDLGEDGLWSSGLSRVPSGTLLIVGPVELNQQSWDDSAKRLEMAALRALGSEHRVAVLVDTQTPEAMCEDSLLLVRSVQQEGDNCDAALLGLVTEDGNLVTRQPFATSRGRPTRARSVATTEAIPAAALQTLENAVAQRTSGLLLFGSAKIEEHPAIELVAASLALTEHAGPAARVMPRNRSTPAKDWHVPDAIKQLPFLPSIESAYDQGYRRIVFSPHYTKAELLLQFGTDALLIAGTYSSSAEDAFMSTMSLAGRQKESDVLALVIAICCVLRIPTKHGEEVATDLFVLEGDPSDIHATTYEQIFEYLQRNRVVRWEDELSTLLSSGKVSAAGLKKALPRNHSVSEFLSQRNLGKKKKGPAR